MAISILAALVWGSSRPPQALRVARSILPNWVLARVSSHEVAVEYELLCDFRLRGR